MRNTMELKFKAWGVKPWTLLDNSIIIGKEEISLDEITDLKLAVGPSILSNGVIQFNVNGKSKTIAFPNKQKKEGNEALDYLLENCKQMRQKFARSPEEIKSEIEALPIKKEWFTRKEIVEFPGILQKNEHIKAMTSGLTDGNTWLISCTNKRVLMMDKGMLYGLKVIDIPLDRINSITYSQGLVLGKISITDGATTRQIDNVSKETVQFFADTVNSEIEAFKSRQVTQSQPSQQVSLADEIIKFKSLLDSGVITNEEFELKKKELLGS